MWSRAYIHKHIRQKIGDPCFDSTVRTVYHLWLHVSEAYHAYQVWTPRIPQKVKDDNLKSFSCGSFGWYDDILKNTSITGAGKQHLGDSKPHQEYTVHLEENRTHQQDVSQDGPVQRYKGPPNANEHLKVTICLLASSAFPV